MNRKIKIYGLMIFLIATVAYWIEGADDSFRYLLIFPIALLAFLLGRVSGNLKTTNNSAGDRLETPVIPLHNPEPEYQELPTLEND